MLDLENLSDVSQAYFDEYVISGSDDELFASGYLRGHVDLVIGGAIVNQETLGLEEVVSKIENSVNTAIKNGELSQSDVESVNKVLNSLVAKLTA